MSHLTRQRFHLNASSEILLSRVVGSIGFALVSAVFSLYFNSIGLSNSQIGLLTGLSSATVVLIAPLTPYLLEKYNGIRVYLGASFSLAIAVASFALISNIAIAAVAYGFTRLMLSLIISSGSITFRDLSGTKTQYTKAQGLASSLMNLGWVTGPLLGGFVLATYGMEATFLMGGFIGVLSALVILAKPINLKQKHHSTEHVSWLDNMRFYFRRPTLRSAYYFNFGRNIWWAFMWTFLPLLMIEQGYSASAIGLTLSATQLPLFLLEFKTVDFIKQWGFRNIFLYCFASMTALMVLALATTSLTLIIGGYIVLSIALSFLEPISDIYLFDQVSAKEEERAFPVYGTAGFASSLVGRVGGGAVIGLLGNYAGFGFVAVILALITLVAYRLPS